MKSPRKRLGRKKKRTRGEPRSSGEVRRRVSRGDQEAHPVREKET
jgi:hypothetical protein